MHLDGIFLQTMIYFWKIIPDRHIKQTRTFAVENMVSIQIDGRVNVSRHNMEQAFSIYSIHLTDACIGDIKDIQIQIGQQLSIRFDPLFLILLSYDCTSNHIVIPWFHMVSDLVYCGKFLQDVVLHVLIEKKCTMEITLLCSTCLYLQRRDLCVINTIKKTHDASHFILFVNTELDLPRLLFSEEKQTIAKKRYAYLVSRTSWKEIWRTQEVPLITENMYINLYKIDPDLYSVGIFYDIFDA